MEEIEREFLVKEMPDLGGRPYCLVAQCVLAHTDGTSYFRARKNCYSGSILNPKFELTKKSGSGQNRREITAEINEEAFELLWELSGNRRIFKIRLFVSLGKETAELDIYFGGLRGLVNVEVEFKDKKAAKEFIPPKWFGPEVTNDESFRDNNLIYSGICRPYFAV